MTTVNKQHASNTLCKSRYIDVTFYYMSLPEDHYGGGVNDDNLK